MYFLSWTLDKFLFPEDFQKIILLKRSGILEDIYLSVLFIALRKETPTKDHALQKQPFPDVYKKDVLKNFLKLIRKTPVPESLVDVGFQPAILSKKNTPTQMFSCKFYDIFKNTFFIDAPLKCPQNLQAKSYV